MDKKCNQCGAPLSEESVFCNKCGSKYETPIPKVDTTKKCTSCGVDLDADSDFCIYCGTKYSRPILDKLAFDTCPSCGEPLKDNALFCGKCGRKVTASAPHLQPYSIAKEKISTESTARQRTTELSTPQVSSKSRPIERVILVSIALLSIAFVVLVLIRFDVFSKQIEKRNMNKAYELLYQGDHQGGKEKLEHILRINPYNIEAMETLASLYSDDGELEASKDLYEGILRIEGNNKDIQDKYDELINEMSTGTITPKATESSVTEAKVTEAKVTESVTEVDVPTSSNEPQTNISDSSEETITLLDNVYEAEEDKGYERIMVMDGLGYFYDTLEIDKSAIAGGELVINNEKTFMADDVNTELFMVNFPAFNEGGIEDNYLEQVITLDISLTDINGNVLHKTVIDGFVYMDDVMVIPEGAKHIFVEEGDVFQETFNDTSNIESLHFIGYRDEILDLSGFDNITYLVAYDCQVDSTITNLVNLNRAAFVSSKINLDAIQTLSGLEYLLIYACEGVDGDIASIKGMTELEVLHILGYNDLFGDIGVLESLGKLQIITIDESHLSGDETSLANPYLEYINVRTE